MHWVPSGHTEGLRKDVSLMLSPYISVQFWPSAVFKGDLYGRQESRQGTLKGMRSRHIRIFLETLGFQGDILPTDLGENQFLRADLLTAYCMPGLVFHSVFSMILCLNFCFTFLISLFRISIHPLISPSVPQQRRIIYHSSLTSSLPVETSIVSSFYSSK